LDLFQRTPCTPLIYEYNDGCASAAPHLARPQCGQRAVLVFYHALCHDFGVVPLALLAALSGLDLVVAALLLLPALVQWARRHRSIEIDALYAGAAELLSKQSPDVGF
jgi:hypothetical protein